MRLPVAAAWNTNATIEGEAREHEAAHAAAAHLLGYEVTEISMDAKWADFGELGHVSIRWAGPTSNDEEFAFARAIVAAAGPCVTDSWDLDSSRGDRETVEAVRWPAWSSYAWEFLVIDKTERLVCSEGFRSLHRRIVKKLEGIGDFGTLFGTELRAVLTTLPGAEPPDGAAAAPFVATSARRSGTHSSAKVASAASGGPRPTSLPAGASHLVHSEVSA